MPRFDIHRRLDGSGYLLDLQANILRGLNTRFVAPLLPPNEAPQPASPNSAPASAISCRTTPPSWQPWKC
jgi:hypothetical protein